MILAGKNLIENSQENAQEDVVFLFFELVRHTMEQTRKEQHFKKELVFLPYKASMWDSLESVWKAAHEDKEHCNAHVIPIPYADLTPEGGVAEWHCERGLFPEYVPTLDWQQVDLEEWHPDVIFIHNPYDNQNRVTSVEARYYSHQLRSRTDLLVHSPYYVTSGYMGEGQALCPAYPNVDYIVVQSEKVCRQFHPSVPREKLLPLGSPKLDKVIRVCREMPEPPEDWTPKMKGRKVYFYNTSLSGLLQDTEGYLRKMRYVFQAFEGREDACLLWRPHPLLEATLRSMREGYMEAYESLKRSFLEKGLGIYDDTPDIEMAIAHSDVYLGDMGTSVTALFGVTGKPLFILNNFLSTPPKEDDWKGEVVRGFHPEGRDWMVTQGSRLYYAANHDFQYHYHCDLPDYAIEYYYGGVVEVEGKAYVYPIQAQDILKVGESGMEKRIPLERGTEKPGVFYNCVHIDEFLFLLPNQYPDIVRYDTRQDKVDYLRGCRDIIAQDAQGERWVGGFAVREGHLLIGGAASAYVLDINPRTLETKKILVGQETDDYGCQFILPDGEDVWLLPQAGNIIRRWTPATGEMREYGNLPESFLCRHYLFKFPCQMHPFTSAACSGEYVYLAPCWGNMFLRLHKESGTIEEWNTQISPGFDGKNGYFFSGSTGSFVLNFETGEPFFYHEPERRWYRFDAERESFEELPVSFDYEEVCQHTPGFAEWSEWFPYGCQENALQTLDGLLDGTLPGDSYDRERQLRAFEEMSANLDGSCGEKVYRCIMEELKRRGKGIS